MWGTTMVGVRRQVSVALVAIAVLAVAACSDDTKFSDASSGSTGDGDGGVPLSAELAQPANNATGVLTSAELSFQTNGSLSDVKLTDDNGDKITGKIEQGVTWIPERQLSWATTYQVKATVKKGKKTTTVNSTFTTMNKPAQGIDGYSYIEEGATVGVGLPLEINFDLPIPADKHAAAERRFFIETTPHTEGSWYWVDSKRIHWRPKNYWKPGTTASVRIGIGGMDFGNGLYGMNDTRVNFAIGNEVITKISNDGKNMTVTENGVQIKSFPISLGKPSTPTPYGTFVAMGKAPELMFDSSTYGVPVDSPEGYRQLVYSNVRLTWGGIFVHSAPWSVGDQGVRNVSHGCINLAPENAQWFYEYTTVGDITIIEGTEEKVAPGDGWTDWNVSWEEYQKGSALYQP